MVIAILDLISSFFFRVVNTFWFVIFPVITLGVACIPIRLSLRNY